MPGDEPFPHDIPNNSVGLSKSVSQTNSITPSTTTSIPSDAQKIKTHQIIPSEKTNDTALYAVPQRIEHKSDLKATLVEKYCEQPQYQNIPNDMLLKRKNSVDANTMTSWTQNGLPVSHNTRCL